jgi:hypothetical protein
MAGVFIDIPGIGNIEAKNAATESTLRELVNAIKGMQGGAGGGGGGGKQGKDLKDFGKGLLGANKSNKAFTKGMDDSNKQSKEYQKQMKDSGEGVEQFGEKAESAGEKAAGLAGSLVGLGLKATDLIDTFASMGNSLNSAAQAMRSIPVVGGVLSNVFGAVVGAAQSQVQAYQELTSIGASFGGDLQEMTKAASATGMTITDFAKVVSNNKDAMMLLGGTTEQGAKRFAELGQSMRQSGLNDELMRMGYSTEQINNGMASYVRIMGQTGGLQGKTTAEIAAGSARYLKEMDGLAKLTGQSREEKEKEREALMKDAQLRASMAGMDADAQEQMMTMIQSFPQEQQAAIKDMIATGQVTSEEALKLNAMMPGAAAQIMGFGRTLQAGGKISKEQMALTMDSAIMEAKENEIRYKQQGMFNQEMQSTYLGMSNLARREVGGMAKAFGEQAETAGKVNLAETLTKTQERLSQLSNTFLNFLAQSGLIDSLSVAIEGLASFVMAVAVPVFSALTAGINSLIPLVIDYVIPAFQVLGEWIQNGLIPIFTDIGAILKDTIGPVFQGTGDVMRDYLQPALYAVSDFIRSNLEPVLNALGLVVGTLALKVLPGLVAAYAKQLIGMLLANKPMLILAMAVGGVAWLMKKFGVDLSLIGDGFKLLKSFIQTLGNNLIGVYYTIMDKITPGDKYKKLLEENAAAEKKNIDDRKQLLTDMENKRKANLDKQAAREKKIAVEAKTRNEKFDAERKAREEKILETKEEAAAADVNMSTPEAMAKSFRDQLLGITKPAAGGGGAAAPMSYGTPISVKPGLGGMAAAFESGKAGSSAIGWDSTGGTSYGKYQIAAKTGTMDKFMEHLKKTNPEAFERLSKSGPSDAGKDGAFAQEWKKLASEGKLQQSEHEFIKATHFDKGVGGLKDQNLKGMLEKSKALQEVMWSTSVQHGGGGASGIFNKVYKEGMTEEDLIKSIYAERGTRFGSSTAQVRGSVQGRFAQEQQMALGMVGQPGSTNMASIQEGYAASGDSTKQAGATSTATASALPAEKNPVELLATLNNKMDELIAVSRQSRDITDRQLSATRDMAGGDGLLAA